MIPYIPYVHLYESSSNGDPISIGNLIIIIALIPILLIVIIIVAAFFAKFAMYILQKIKFLD